MSSNSDVLPSAKHPRSGHEAVVLGKEVVVFGGLNAGGVITETEIFVPERSQWETAGNMVTPRSATQSVMLDDGQILCLGGVHGSASSDACEVFTARSREWTARRPMPRARDSHACAPISGGVAVVGGRDLQNGLGTVLSGIDTYSTQQDAWTRREAMAWPRMNHTVTAIGDYLVVAGGYVGSDKATDAVEIIDTRSWKCETTTSMSAPRMQHSAIALNEDEVLVVGGTLEPFGEPLRTAEIFSLRTRSWRRVADLDVTRTAHRATLTANGVMITGTSYSDLPLGRWGHRPRWESMRHDVSRSDLLHPYDARIIERFDRKNNAWARHGELQEPRYAHTATVLPSGLVFVFGGSLSMLPDSTYLNTAESFV